VSGAVSVDAQYREFKLSDGRDFVAIIEATETEDFRVRVPQGEMAVSFTQLFDMTPVTRAEYDAQPEWVVFLAVPEERRKGIASAFASIPRVAVYDSDVSSARITRDQGQRATLCDVDVACIAGVLSAAPWVWIVSARQEGSDLVFSAQTNTGTPRQNPVRAAMISPERIREAPFTLLDITPVAGVESAVVRIQPVGLPVTNPLLSADARGVPKHHATRPVLLGVVGASVVTSAVSYATAWHAHSAFVDTSDTTIDLAGLTVLQRRSRTFTSLSVITLGVAVGAGGISLVVEP